MSIRFYCEACQTRIKVPDGNEGRPVRCPKCSHLQRVPVDTQELSSAAVTEQGDPHDLALLAGAAGDSLDIEPEPPAPNDDSPESPEILNDPGLPGSPGFEKYDESVEPGGDRSHHPHEGRQNEVDLPDEEHDPLAALAAQADGGDSSMTPIAVALKGVDDPRNHGSEAVHVQDILEDNHHSPDLVGGHDESSPSDLRYPEPGAVDLPTALAGAAGVTSSRPARPVTPSTPLPSETSKRRPVSPSTKTSLPPSPPGRTSERQLRRDPSPAASSKRRQHSPSPPPNAVPLSKSTPTTSHAEPLKTGNATIDLSSRPRRTKPGKKNTHGYIALQIIAWLLRLLALLAIGGLVKLLLIAIDEGRTMVDRVLILLAGLTCSAVVWAVGEIASAVRDIARRPES